MVGQPAGKILEEAPPGEGRRPVGMCRFVDDAKVAAQEIDTANAHVRACHFEKDE